MPQRSTNFVAKRITSGALNNITRLSEFRKFLTVNRDAIQAAAGGYRISWARLLELPEIEAQKFRDTKGRPISSRLAARVWQDVLNASKGDPQAKSESRSTRITEEPAPSSAVAAVPADRREIVAGDDEEMVGLMTDMLKMDPRTRRNAPEAARRIAARLAREREEK